MYVRCWPTVYMLYKLGHQLKIRVFSNTLNKDSYDNYEVWNEPNSSDLSEIMSIYRIGHQLKIVNKDKVIKLEIVKIQFVINGDQEGIHGKNELILIEVECLDVY